MAAYNPPWTITASSQTAESYRRMLYYRSTARGGVFSGLAVSQHAGTPNMSVDVSEGAALVLGTEATYQGGYLCESQGVTTVTIAAAHATLNRLDLVVAKVQDAQYSGATNSWSLAAVTGTAAATPRYPTVPANAIVLAVVAVAPAATQILNASITDLRSASASDGLTTLVNRGYMPGAGQVVQCTSATNPSTATLGLQLVESDTGLRKMGSGSAWITIGGISAEPSWTPTITQGVAVTKTVGLAKYNVDGKRVQGECYFTCTSSGTASNAITVSIPVTAAAAITHGVGSGYFGSGGVFYPVIAYLASTTTIGFLPANVTGGTTVFGVSGLTQLVNTSIGTFTFSYEAA